jgi:hypothetical protein
MDQKAVSGSLSATLADRVDAFLSRKRLCIVAASCCFAVARILIFAGAFPLFNNVDEQDHYEMVYKYAQHYTPARALPLCEPEMARVFALYGSPEYLRPQELLRLVHMDTPIAKLSSPMREERYQQAFTYWLTQPNIEAQSPPVYYMVAALWYRAGAVLGVKDWALAYWVRAFNAVVYGIFVWISFLFVKQVYPERDFLCVAVPVFLAVFPQDVFWGMNRDILSPLLAAIVLLLLFRAMQEKSASEYGLIVGAFLVGISFLTDVSNFVLFGVLAIILYVLAARARKSDGGSRDFALIGGAAMAALLPPLLWMAHNRVIMGDLTGSRAKIAYLGWTMKPWQQVWQHPLLSIRGMNFFLGELIPRYWRGEYAWQGSPMKWQVADWFYIVSSYLMLAVFAMYLLRQKKADNPVAHLSSYLSLYLVVASVLFLAAISLPFDFQRCFYPSRAYPYFVSGRIISGTLLPFALIYLNGFEYIWRPIRKYVHPIIPFSIICVFILYAQVLVTYGVFHSAFNFFALRGM